MTAPKSNPPIAFPRMSNLKRRVLPLASTAAALALSACGAPALPAQPVARQESEPAVALTPQMKQVEAFAADATAALEKTDPQRLKIAGGAAQQIPEKTPASEKSAAQVILAQNNPPIEIARPPIATPVETPTTLPAAGTMTHVMDGPPGVNVSTMLPPISVTAALPTYTVYSPRKEPVLVNSTAEVAVAPAVAGAAEKPVVRTEPTMDIALDVIRKQVAAHPTLNTTLALALLEQADGKSPDTKLKEQLSEIDQQLLADLLSSLTALNAPAGTSTLPDRAAPLVAAAKKWQAQADLSLPKLTLASRVESFGVYTPVEPKFKTGEKHTVIVYCEVANFLSKKSADGWFETRLSQQETLATDDGLLLWRPNAEEVQDRSMNQRRDFYLVKKLVIPDNLAIGKYALRMSVTDRNTNKIAVVNLPIEIIK